MCYKDSENNRNIEIKTMFFTVLRMKINEGMTRIEAKEEAYNAIRSRYHLSSSRTRIIIAETARIDDVHNLPSFISNNEELIRLMKKMNSYYEDQIKQFSEFIYSSNRFVSEITTKIIDDYANQSNEINNFISLMESVNVECKKRR